MNTRINFKRKLKIESKNQHLALINVYQFKYSV